MSWDLVEGSWKHVGLATLKSLQTGVKTFKDVAQLVGSVDSAQSARLAGRVAAGIPGFAGAKNDLIVK